MRIISETATTKRPAKRISPSGVVLVAILICLLIYQGRFLNSTLSFEQTNAAPAVAVLEEYAPSLLESYLLREGATNPKLRLDRTGHAEMPSGCRLWRDPNATTPEIHSSLQDYRREQRDYESAQANWAWTHDTINTTNANRRRRPHDLRNYMSDGKAVCESLKIHPEGLAGIFAAGGGLLSGHRFATPEGQNSVYIEPLLPPMRHPEYCFGRGHLLDTSYIVHDFAALCRNKLHRQSKTVFVDLGASLSFHLGGASMPIIDLVELYARFGFRFDHIYAYELKPEASLKVYNALPDDIRPAYHWFNVGVESDPNSNRNPFKMLAENYHPDDFVVVKLDIDTSKVEVPLVHQLLDDTYIDPETGVRRNLADLVSVFYFEHHVFMKEIARNWGKDMKGSIMESMELFHGLRRKGVASHFWI